MDGPDRRKDCRAGRGGNGLVQGLRGKATRGIEVPRQPVVGLRQVGLTESHGVKELVPRGNLRGPKGPLERETP